MLNSEELEAIKDYEIVFVSNVEFWKAISSGNLEKCYFWVEEEGIYKRQLYIQERKKIIYVYIEEDIKTPLEQVLISKIENYKTKPITYTSQVEAIQYTKETTQECLKFVPNCRIRVFGNGDSRIEINPLRGSDPDLWGACEYGNYILKYPDGSFKLLEKEAFEYIYKK